MQATIKARATSVPSGAFITSMGGWNPVQFAEKRLPTLAELDAATSDRPVLVFQGFTGPAATNTPGKAFFTSKGIAVSDTGAIGVNAPSMAALNALRAIQTFDDRKRGTVGAMAYSASVGVTTNADMGAFNLPGTPDLQGSFEADTLASDDQSRMYDAFVALHREGRMTVRLRIYFLTMDTRPEVPILSERLRNDFNGFGDDMMRISGIGEFASSWPLFGQKPPDNYQTALSRIAKAGWAFQQHSLSPAENELTVSTFEAVNKITPIKDLRWSLAHVGTLDVATINRLKAIGAGDRGASLPVPRGRTRGTSTPHDRGQRRHRRRRFRLGPNLDAQSVEHDFVHGHGTEFGRLAHQRRSAVDAHGGAAAVHGGEWLVPEGRSDTRNDRAWKARGCRRAQRRLLRPEARPRRCDQEAEVGVDGRRRQDRAQHASEHAMKIVVTTAEHRASSQISTPGRAAWCLILTIRGLAVAICM